MFVFIIVLHEPTVLPSLLTLTPIHDFAFNLQKATAMAHTQAKYGYLGSVSLKVCVEKQTNRRTDGHGHDRSHYLSR